MSGVTEIMSATNHPNYADAYAKIATTMYREAYAMDKQDWALLTAQYTDDAVFETTTDFGQLPAEIRRLLAKGVRGHQQIVDYVRIASGGRDRPPGMWGQHVYTNIWIEKLEDDAALARGYVAGLGRIEQDLVRASDGIWRIKRKKIICNAFPPVPPQMPAEWLKEE